MRKILAFLLALVATSFIAQANEVEAIQKAGVLKVAHPSEETPPFLYKADGKVAGLDVELIEAMAEKLKVKVEWVQSEGGYSKLFKLLELKKADVAVSALFPTLDRLSQCRFSHPYLMVKQVIYVQRKAASKLKLPDNYNGLIARNELSFGYYPNAGFVDGLLKSSIAVHWIPYEGDPLTGKSARDRMLADFMQGKVSAVWVDEVELDKWRQIKPDIDIYGYAVMVPDGQIPITVATRKESTDLMEWINLFIDYAKRGEVLKRIHQKHLQLMRGKSNE